MTEQTTPRATEHEWEDLPADHREKTGSSGSVSVIGAARLPGAPVRMVNHWIDRVPDPNPYVPEHRHDYDEILYFVGSDTRNPDDLGAVVTFAVDGVEHTIDRSTAFHIPAGTPHGPLTYVSVTRPHSFLATYLAGEE